MCDSDSCLIELCYAVFQAIVIELQGGGAEGICLDHRGAGFDISFVDLAHDFGLLDIHEFGAAACLQSSFLQHRSHGAVKNMDHAYSPYFGITTLGSLVVWFRTIWYQTLSSKGSRPCHRQHSRWVYGLLSSLAAVRVR